MAPVLGNLLSFHLICWLELIQQKHLPISVNYACFLTWSPVGSVLRLKKPSLCLANSTKVKFPPLPPSSSFCPSFSPSFLHSYPLQLLPKSPPPTTHSSLRITKSILLPYFFSCPLPFPSFLSSPPSLPSGLSISSEGVIPPNAHTLVSSWESFIIAMVTRRRSMLDVLQALPMNCPGRGNYRHRIKGGFVAPL